MQRTYYIVAPDGTTIITRRSSRTFYWVALVRLEGEDWEWVRWSATYKGADNALVGWIRNGGALKLVETYIGRCHEVTC